jgi:hypothetical protein
MKTVLLALFAMVALVVAPSVAMAGGGTKPTSIVKVKNSSSTTIIAVLADSTNPLTNLNTLISGSTPPTVAQVQAAASADKAQTISVPAGGTGTFPAVQAGTYSLLAADVGAGGIVGAGAGVTAPATITIAKGKTVTKTVSVAGGSLGIN